ncbi:Ig-like domain-containing protein, partial [bacterium]|nr:Ig-like domain-containing protein [bacterium]
ISYLVLNEDPDLAEVLIFEDVLYFSSNQNKFGRSKIEIIAKSSHHSTAQTLLFVVSSVNDLPTVQISTFLQLDEDMVGLLPYVENDVEDQNQALTVRVVSPANNGSIEFGDSHLLYSANQDFFGSDQFVLEFKDSDGGSVEKSIDVFVSNIDDGPKILNHFEDIVQDEDSAALFIKLFAQDIDNDQSQMSFTASIDNVDLAEVIVVNNEMAIIPKEDAHGKGQITIKVNSNNQEDQKSFKYTLRSLNDSPHIGQIADILHVQSSQEIQHSISLKVWDDEPLKSLRVFSTNSSLISSENVSISISGILKYKIPKEQKGYTKLFVVVTDQRGLSHSMNFKVSVNANNDSLCVQNIAKALSFEVFKGQNQFQNYITEDLNLIRSFPTICQASIVWKSSNVKVIEIQQELGKLMLNQVQNQIVALRARVIKNDSYMDKRFLLEVPRSNLSTVEVLEKALSDLTFDKIRGLNQRRGRIVSSLSLIKETLGNSIITWSSSNEMILHAMDGSIDRSDLRSDTTIDLTATIIKDEFSVSKKFHLMVRAIPLDDHAITRLDQKWLTYSRILGSNDSRLKISQDLLTPLPTLGAYGSSIKWTSSKTDYISIDGNVVRNEIRDQLVLLTAKIRHKESSLSKNFVFRVLHNPLFLANENIVSLDFESFEQLNLLGQDRSLKFVSKNPQQIDQIYESKVFLAKNIKDNMDTTISEDKIKSVYESELSLVYVSLNTDHSVESQIEFIDQNSLSSINRMLITAAQSSTFVVTDGSVISSYASTLGDVIEATLGQDGMVSHEVKFASHQLVSNVRSNLFGSQVILNEDAVTTTYQEVRQKDDGSETMVQASVETDKLGNSCIHFSLQNVKTGETKVIDTKVNGSDSFAAGHSIEFLKKTNAQNQEKIYIRVIVPITRIR